MPHRARAVRPPTQGRGEPRLEIRSEKHGVTPERHLREVDGALEGCIPKHGAVPKHCPWAHAAARGRDGMPTFPELYEHDDRGELVVDDEGAFVMRPVPRKELPPVEKISLRLPPPFPAG
jgi:hypothetical protein